MDEFRDGLSFAFEDATKEIRAKWKEFNQHSGILESLQGFIAAVDWSEPWLISLLACEALLLVSLIAFRKQTRLQGTVMVTAGAIVYCAEYINRFLGDHWQSFARQPYFDPHGIFISAVVSAPLMLATFIALVNYLVAVSQALVAMKRKELRYNLRQRAKQEEGSGQGKKHQ
ncbi:hypothetical protein WJX73_002711 [Symbiochloris irregularis]|uniref:Transmembrane protein 18 n=1 Tax=Symbiochloris irregularis TaxID=706552 RepID=A0AAW1PCG7_9CHLO